MEKQFEIIKTLCRSALAHPSNAIQHQIRRLVKTYEADGHKEQAEALLQVLNTTINATEMSPSKLQKSFVTYAGEILTKSTQVPIDKETSAPLAEVIMPNELPGEMPRFDDDIYHGINSVINEWQQFQKLVELKASPASSCLIYGDPGTGKTHLALWIAKQIGMPVLLARLDGLMSSFLGTTSRNIGSLFNFANRYKCLLLLDEFDAIAKLRNDSQEVGEIKRVVNTLLQSLDSRHEKGFTIGVTNHESLLDPAIWRRFDIQIKIPVPSFDVMIQILMRALDPLKFKPVELQLLAWSLENGSGADAQVMAKWIKRSLALDPDADLVTIIKQFALLNAGRITSHKRNALLHNMDQVISALINDYNLKQKDLAPVFGLTQSTLSKQLSKNKL